MSWNGKNFVEAKTDKELEEIKKDLESRQRESNKQFKELSFYNQKLLSAVTNEINYRGQNK